MVPEEIWQKKLGKIKILCINLFLAKPTYVLDPSFYMLCVTEAGGQNASAYQQSTRNENLRRLQKYYGPYFWKVKVKILEKHFK